MSVRTTISILFLYFDTVSLPKERSMLDRPDAGMMMFAFTSSTVLQNGNESTLALIIKFLFEDGLNKSIAIWQSRQTLFALFNKILLITILGFS